MRQSLMSGSTWRGVETEPKSHRATPRPYLRGEDGARSSAAEAVLYPPLTQAALGAWVPLTRGI